MVIGKRERRTSQLVTKDEDVFRAAASVTAKKTTTKNSTAGNFDSLQ